MKGHVVFPAPSLKELEEDIKAEMRTGWNPDALEKVRVRTVLLSKAFDVLAVAGYSTIEYWLQGGKVVTGGAYTVDLGETYETVPTGKHYIYFDGTGIHTTQTPWNLARKDIVFTGVVYWNGGSLYTGWHCHAWNYPADLRAAARPAITSGLAVTINALESHKIDISDGVLKFADIEANIRGNVTGHETFKQRLVAIEARRLWKAGGLWYDDTESELVAKLDGSNNVQYCDPATGLQSLVDGEYTAVWLAATFCNHRPVKIVLGSSKGSTAEEAKTLNTPESYNDLAFRNCADVSHPISRIIVKDIAVEPWYELVEIDDTIRDDEIFNYIVDRHVVDMSFDENTRELTLFRNERLPPLVAEIPGGDQSNVVIYQPNHGLSAEQAIRHNGSIYVLAQADNDANSLVCGIVSEVIDADHFRYVTDGFISGGSWTPGYEYFLSPSVPGLVTTLSDPESWSVGQVRLSLGWGTTQGLKVEIDVGDVIDELPAVRLKGIWDREFEFCINQGYAESFTADYYAVYPYKILELIIGVDNGTLPDSSIQINGVPVTGLNNITISGKAVFTASNLNEVVEGNEVTVNTSGSFTGDPQIIKGKLKIMRE